VKREQLEIVEVLLDLGLNWDVIEVVTKVTQREFQRIGNQKAEE